MSDRSALIAKAASLPVGNPERKSILTKLAADYHGDPNVGLESIYYNARRAFCEDVVKAIIRYSSLKTPVQGKPGGVHGRGDVAFGNLVNRTDSGNLGLGIEVKVRGDSILIELSDLDDKNAKTWKFPTHDTPASMASTVSWYGTALLTGGELR